MPKSKRISTGACREKRGIPTKKYPAGRRGRVIKATSTTGRKYKRCYVYTQARKSAQIKRGSAGGTESARLRKVRANF